MKKGYLFNSRKVVSPFVVFNVDSVSEKTFVVASMVGDSVSLSCSHDWLEGRKAMPSTLLETDSQYEGHLKASRGALAQQAKSCDDFVKTILTGNPSCKHTDAVRSFLNGDSTGATAVECISMGLQGTGLDGLKTYLLGMSATVDEITQRELTVKEAAKMTNVLLLGPAGGGKTSLAYELAAEHGAKLEKIAFFEGIRPHEILGHISENTDGVKGWQDGPLSRAFRLARRGTKAIVLLDEITRADPRTSALCLGPMSRTPHATYVLSTGRCLVDPVEPEIFYSETIEVPCDMICFIGTGNIGEGYDVNQLDRALLDRFGFVQVLDSELATLEKILGIHKASKEVSEKVINFFKVVNSPKIRNQLELSPSVRAMDMIFSEYGGNIRGALLGQLQKWTLSADSENGPDSELYQMLKKLIDEI